MTSHAYTGRLIFPVDAPPIECGTITIDGDKISAVEPHGTRSPDVDLGNVAILPGFVNTHTHLDLSGARSQCPPTPDFTQWLRQVIAFRRSRTPEQVQADIAAGLAECLRFGTTLIGDIAAGGASWGHLTNARCRAVAFYELLGLTEERAAQSWQASQAWSDAHRTNDRCRPGFSPHAPYSVRNTLYQALGKLSSPIATHLAESPQEVELLWDNTGPFIDLLTELNLFDRAGLVPDPLDVIEYLPRGIFVHGNFLPAAAPFSHNQSLVICPRTHAAFRYPYHPFPRMRVRVALGTDSLASNPDLDILAEARFLHQAYAEVEPAMVLRMLTLNGAEALGFGNVTGSLMPGKSADLVVLPLPNVDVADPHDLVFESQLPVLRVMFRGQWRE